MLCRHMPSLCSHSPLEHHRDVWSMLHGSSHWSPLCADLKNTGSHSTFTMAQGMHRPSQKRTTSTFIVKLRCSVQAIARLVGTEDEGIQKRFNSGISKRCGCDGGFILATGISPVTAQGISTEATAEAMVASASFSKVPPIKQATLMALPSAVNVTVSTGGLAGLSSLAGTPSKNDLAVAGGWSNENLGGSHWSLLESVNT